MHKKDVYAVAAPAGARIRTHRPAADWVDRVKTANPQYLAGAAFTSLDLPSSLAQRMSTEAAAARAAEAQGLRDRLLAIGGWQAIVRAGDEDFTAIARRGRLWTRKGLDFARCTGERSACHQNAARMAMEDRSLLVGTGYALSMDGVWRSHSWIFRERNDQVQIVETTELRVAYFGFLPRVRNFIGTVLPL